ncbi:MAG: Glycosyl transferase family 2 [bacterium ADurb.BinA186]|jgi:glycosyltransferase involved in cell wall biosynthesis|nr:MAG: Glycosyl transferase family 2 [bacterium ADurb.BinA186]
MSLNKEDQPRLFLITTIYGHRDRLERTLQSVLEQTSADFVHYIYDDAGPENCDDVIETYRKKALERHTPFNVIYEKGQANLGVDGAHQRAFSLCTCPYFMWLDVGDYLDPAFIANALKEVQKHPECSFFHFNDRSYDETSGVWKKPTSAQFKMKELAREDQLPNFLGNANIYFHHFIVKFQDYKSINPSLFIQDGRKNGGLWYDAQIVFEMVCANQKMHFVKKPLSFVFQDPHSVATFGKYDEALKRENEMALLRQLKCPSERIQFIEDYQRFLDAALSVKKLCLSGQKKEAVSVYQGCRRFMKDHHLPSHYFVYRDRAHFFFRCAKNPLLLKVYRKLKHC